MPNRNRSAPIVSILTFATLVSLAGQPALGTDDLLRPLTTEMLQDADLEGEIGCSFTDNEADVLVVAFGNVATDDPADAIVMVRDRPKRLSAPGGFDAMLEGTTFAGEALELEVEIVGETIGGGESPPFRARLTVRPADVRSQVHEGFWTCGP
jgi:hypothetical protein